MLLIPTECLRQAGELPVKTQEIYENKFLQLINNKTVHFLALFITVYVGVEVTITGKSLKIFHFRDSSLILDYDKLGWIVTFMMIVRGGGPTSGYISTGFYSGKHLTPFVFFLY